MSMEALWRPCLVSLFCFGALVVPTYSEAYTQRMMLSENRPCDRQQAFSTAMESSQLGLRLRGGGGNGGSGGKERHRRRSKDKKSAANPSQREKPAGKKAGSSEGLAFQDKPPTLETLLDNPAVQDFATNLFSNPGFQAMANSMLSDQKNLDMLKSYAGMNGTYSAEEREELANFLGLDSNTPEEQANATSNATAAEASNSSSAAVAPEGGEGREVQEAEEAQEGGGAQEEGEAKEGGEVTEEGAEAKEGVEGTVGGEEVGALMEAMGEFAKGTFASQWSHDKERQMRTNPELSQLQDSAKVREMQAEIAANGPMAALKYVDDPEAMEIIQKIIGITMQ